MTDFRGPMRVSRTAIACASLVTSLCSACSRPSDSPPQGTDLTVSAVDSVEATGAEAADSASLAASRDAATALGQGLMKALLAEVASGGPDAALAFCADSAQTLTARYRAEGIDVHRTSLRVRNPANAPDSVEVRVLEYLAERKAAGTLPTEFMEVRRRSDGSRELRYFRPITVADGCLTCHGPTASISPSLRTVLSERYPDDAAVDYAEGDLRGVIAVRTALPAR